MPPARILIVEDEEILADNLKVYLGRRTPDVRIAPDAETAMEMLKTFSPDLVVLDYALPGIDGLRAYGDIVRTSSHQPGCIMITGYLNDFLAEKAHQQGINHLLCKPFSFAELQHEVDLSSEERIGKSAIGIRQPQDRRSQQIHWHTSNRRRELRRSQLLCSQTTL